MRLLSRKLLLLLALALLFVATSLPASAAVVFSNLAGADSGVDFNIDGVAVTGRAVAFTVPAGASYRFNSATLVLGRISGSLPAAATVSLRQNNAGVPGTAIATLGTVNPTTYGYLNYTVTSAGGISLTGGTTYWLVVTAPLTSGQGNVRMMRTTAAFSGVFTPAGQKNNSVLGWQNNLLGGSFKVAIDAGAPVTVTSITRAGANPTNAASVSWNVTFSGSITGLTTSSFAPAQTGVSGALVTGISGSGASYVVTASTGTGDGTLGLNLANSTNLLPGVSTTLPFAGEVYTLDRTAPATTISSLAANPTNVSPIPVTVSFSEEVTGFDPSTAIVVTNGTAGNFAGTPSSVTFDLTPTASGLITVNVAANVAADSAGNGNMAAAQFSITYDGTAPAATISSAASPGPTSTSPIPVTVTFSEAVTGFDVTDVIVSNGSAGNFAGSGTLYSFDVTPAGAGVVTVDVPANAAQDSVGNGSTAAAQFSITFDANAPGVVISSSAPNPTNTTPIPVTVTFSEPVTGFDVLDVVVGNGSAGSFAGSGAVYTFTVTPAGFGAVTVNVPANAAQDSASNGNTAAAQFSITYGSAALNGVIVLYVPNDGTDAVTTIANPLGGPATFAIVSGGTVDPATGAFWYDVLPGAAPGDIYVTVLITSGAQTFNQIVQIVVMAAPPPVPLCEAHNFDEGGVVRSGAISDATAPFINCRVLYQNGSPTTWLGADLYGAGNLGVPGLIELGVQQAVDIFSPSGLGYFDGGAVFCLRGAGTLIWLDGNQSPKTAEIIGSYTVPEFAGFTCATLFEPGTLILVSDNPAE